MYRTTTLACALLCAQLCAQLSAQLVLTFDNNDLSYWQGDVQDFIVNDKSQLQLNAENAGQSSVFTELIFYDSLVWEIDVSLGFSPSGSNRLIIWLSIDSSNISIANGYYLEIGESGNDDAIHLYQLINGEAILLASGIMGSVSNSFEYKFNLEKRSNDVWILNTTNLKTNNTIEEFVLYIPESNMSDYKYFGISCYYTQSRKEAFAFDNIRITEKIPDTIPPDITKVEIIDSDKVRISFSEKITRHSAENMLNYSFNPNIIISQAILDSTNMRQVDLILNSDLPGGQLITLLINNIEDLFHNTSSERIFDIELIEQAERGDILINEILFDPHTGGEDFIELINHSDKNINLVGWQLYNSDKDEHQIIVHDFIIRPNKIVAFSENVEFLYNEYQLPEHAQVLRQALPSLNNSDGNVSIIQIDNQIKTTIDSFDYQEDYHHALLKETEGISLERVSLTGKTNDPNNWFSASEVQHFATPGYQNSTRINSSESDGSISLYDKIFAPDQDGYKDHLIIQYALQKPGYIANISIFDDRGRIERRLIRNSSLSTEGIIIWDGLNEEGQVLPIGIYIILYELYHSDGDIISGKKACVLAQKLD